ncbi:hypothetical protein PIB30_079510 [Stylosanthes scabra]|uniref:Uncharacterized protein n=1 Tax=Stylosanthes scabra TaxID=79078 RepID=A0ABU6WUJ7_9FABA|nr:hypothetical protein [Stylosanthes scabra]
MRKLSNFTTYFRSQPITVGASPSLITHPRSPLTIIARSPLTGPHCSPSLTVARHHSPSPLVILLTFPYQSPILYLR